MVEVATLSKFCKVVESLFKNCAKYVLYREEQAEKYIYSEKKGLVGEIYKNICMWDVCV